jgi:16S rRNA processing protein RimM
MTEGALAPPSDLVELGVVRGVWGVKGWVRIVPHDADADVLWSCRRWWLRRPGAVEELEVEALRRHVGVLLAKWAGCESPEAAAALRGATVGVARSQFPLPPEGSYYWIDLIGCRVVNRAGELIGTVRGLDNNGVQDLLDVVDGAASRLIPMVEAYVDHVDVKAHTITVDWQRDW